MRALLLLGLPALLLGVRNAAATPTAELSASEREIDDAICDDVHRAGTWNAVWGTVFGVAAVGSAGVAALAPGDWLDGDHRAGLYVTAAKASIGAVVKLVAPLEVEGVCHDPHPLSARARHATLAEAARRERRALIPNLFGGLALNTAGLLYLGYGRGTWEIAWISFGIGSAVGITSTLTAPLHSYLLQRRRDRARHVAIVPVFGPGGSGVAFAGSW